MTGEGAYIRLNERDRGIEAHARSRWDDAHRAFMETLSNVSADAGVLTTEVHVRARETPTSAAFVASLTPDEHWAYVTVKSGEQLHGLAVPVRHDTAKRQLPLALFIEFHSRLVGWWLTYAWRSQQLAIATAELADAKHFIAAASCARALLETAAAFWVDSRALTELWADLKRKRPTASTDTLRAREAIVDRLNEIQFGAKFSDHAPDAKASFGGLNRTNVLGQIQKLARACDDDVQTDYEWLCNTVHPSLGTALVFSAQMVLHDTKTHAHRMLSGRPIIVDDGQSLDAFIAGSIPAAIARATSVALEVLGTTLDAAIRMIDDVGLTSGAPGIADFDYWRALTPAARNGPCPCRSGKKSKQCVHSWGQPAPTIPTRFGQANA